MRTIAIALGAALIAIGGGLATPLATKLFPNNDGPWFWIGAAIAAVGLMVTVGSLFIKPEPAAQPVDQSVRSNFQFGGITAHTVNTKPNPRHVLDPKLKRELERALHQLDPTLPVVVGYPVSDQEAAQFALQIKNMVEQQGGQADLTAWAVATANPGVVCYPDTNTIFVGPQS